MDRLPPRTLSIPELVKRHLELQREFDDYKVMVMLKLRDLEEQVADLTEGMRNRDRMSSEVEISAHPRTGSYRASLRAIPAWAIVVIIAIAGATVAATCSSSPPRVPSPLTGFLQERLK